MRRLLISALAVGLALFAGTLAAHACEAGHWIEKVSDDGKIVILEDSSVWVIDPVDRVDTALWTETDEIIACADKLINTEEKEVAGARRIR
jgi:hypothetical protein